MYLHGVRLHNINLKLTVHVQVIKFVVLPTIAFFILFLVPLEPMIKGFIFMELFMPLAVTNVNLGSLYNCRAQDITAQIFISSLLFLALSFFALHLIKLF
jgi:predicted permease